MIYSSENEARSTKIEGYSFTVHFVVSLACEYELIAERKQFYQMTERMQAAIIRQMLPYVIDYCKSKN